MFCLSYLFKSIMNEFYMQKYKLSMQNNCTPKENPPFIGKFACFKTEYYLFTPLFHKQTEMFGQIGFYIRHTIA